MGPGDRSLAEVFQDIVRNLQEIVRAEIRLAKTEIREEATKAKFSLLLLGLGALAALFAILFLLLTIVLALALVIPTWAAALIVGSVLAVGGGLTLNTGIKSFKKISPSPVRTVETIKENVEWAKQQTK